MLFDRKQYMMGRDTEYPTTEKLETNCAVLLFRVNKLLEQFVADGGVGGKTITSGYRPGHFNEAAGGAPNSAHLTCEAVDIADPAGSLRDWINAHPHVLDTYNLWREDPTQTKGWVHLQIRPANNRSFKK